VSGSDVRGRALRVAILIGQFPPHDVGGAERQADRLAAALAARGHEVTVITRRWPGRAARETRDGFAIVRTPVALTGVARSALDAVVTLDALRRMRPRPDVVLAFQTFVSGWIAGLADVALGLPSVVWVRGENEYRFDRLPRLYPFSKLAWKHARRVLVQSEAHRPALLEHVARRNPLLAERLAPCLETLGNGVDVPAVPLPPGYDWLYVGRLIAHKRVDVLLDALASVRGTAAERPLWIVGDGPERAALEARAKALGVDARFAGMRPHEELTLWHARARAIVLPSSEGEGLPNALLEAMAAGVPAIATRLPGVEELVRGAGELATAGQPASFAQALLALSNPDARARASTTARERGAACGWDAMAARLERVLAEAAAPAPRIWRVGPDPGSRGGVAAVGRQLLVSPLVRHYRLNHMAMSRPGSIFTRARAAAWGVGKLAVALVVRPPDVIQIQVASTGSFARKILVGSMARARGVPMIVRIYGGGFDQFLQRSPRFVLATARWWLAGADQVIALSERWADRLRPLLPGVQIDVVPNPRPAVCTAVAGGPELLHDGVTGYVVPPPDPIALAERLSSLMESGQQRRQFGAAAHARVEAEFTLKRSVQEAERQISKIATARPGRVARGPIRLALVLDKTFVGGVELLMLDVFKNFDPRVVEPRVICLRTAGPLAADYRAAGFRVDVMGRRGRFDPRTLPRLVKALRQGGTDAVLVTHHHRASLALGRLAARLSEVPVNLVAVHNMDLTRVGTRCLPRWAVATLRASDALVLLSPSQREYLHREEQVGRHPWSRTEEVVIPSGVAMKPRPNKSERAAARAGLGLSAEDFVVGIVARLSAQKAHHVLFEAFARLREGHSRARLVVVGGGDREMELRLLAARLRLEDSVVFTGVRRDVPALLPAFDVSCLSSVHEGVPMAAIEAMAAGIPMVVTDCGALRDVIIDGEQGFIVPVGDSYAMAERLLALADDSKLRERLGEAAHGRVQRMYRIEHTARGYQDLLVGLLGAR
jgi:glycosyltransferase involved in cell wall biosynthesis